MNFKCKICKKICNENYSGTHLKKEHNISGKEYYDKYIKTNNECKICKQSTSFLTIKKGYRECCSRFCSNKYRNENLEKNLGVTNIFQLKSIKQKIKLEYLRSNCLPPPMRLLRIAGRQSG